MQEQNDSVVALRDNLVAFLSSLIQVIRGNVAGNVATRAALTVGAILVLIGNLYLQVRVTSNHLPPLDFEAYYQAALAVRARGNPFTPVTAWIATYQTGQPLLASFYVYAPFFAALLIPFTFFPFRVAYLLWSLSSVAFLVGAIYAALRVCGIRPTLLHVALLSVVASLWNIVRFDLQVGQADLFVLFFVAASLWARYSNRPILAGVLLAVACVTKPFLLCLVVALLWKREYRYALVTLGAFVVGLLAPFLWLSGAVWRDQLTVWSFWSNQYVSFQDNQAPKVIFARLFTINPYATPLLVAPWLMTALWLGVVALVALICAACVARRRLAQDDRTLVELSLVTTAVFLISPLTEFIHLVMLVLPLVLLTTVLQRRGWWAPRYRLVTIGVALIWLTLIFPIKSIEYFSLAHMATATGLALIVYCVLAAPFVLIVAGLFALEIRLFSLIVGRSLMDSLRALRREVWARLNLGKAVAAASRIEMNIWQGWRVQTPLLIRMR